MTPETWAKFEELNSEGGCYALIPSDGGLWACVADGLQPVPGESGGFVGYTTFLMDADDWCPTIEAAIEHAHAKRQAEIDEEGGEVA